MTPAHPSTGIDHSTGTGDVGRELSHKEQLAHSSHKGAEVGKASGRTHCPPPLALGKTHTSSQDPALSRAPIHLQPPFLGPQEKEAQGGREDAWESWTANAHHSPPETPRPLLCSDSTISHGISLQGSVQPSARTWLSFSSLPRCHWVPATHVRIARLWNWLLPKKHRLSPRSLSQGMPNRQAAFLQENKTSSPGTGPSPSLL